MAVQINVIATGKGYFGGAVRTPGTSTESFQVAPDQFSEKWMRPKAAKDAAALLKALGDKAPEGMKDRMQAMFEPKDSPAEPEVAAGNDTLAAT